MYETAIDLLKKINHLGYEAYIIGGYPRDLYRGIQNKDIDICSNISEEILLSNFNVVSSTQFGSFIIKEKSYLFEITLFRKEIYSDNRYPKISYVSSLEEDLLRRDFVMNTLCIDSNNCYVDLMNAREDIDQKIIRTVGNINLKMKEDPLRIVRAIRFSADLDFVIEPCLKEYIVNHKEILKKLSKSRIEKELKKVNHQTNFYKLIKELDLTDYIQ